MARTQLEPTGKIFKLLMVVGAVLAIIGIIRYVAMKDQDPGAGLLLVFLGIVVFVIGKFLAWWKHS